MAKRKEAESPASKRGIVAELIDKGNLRMGCPLGCIVSRKILQVGVATKEGIKCSCGCLKCYSMIHFESHAGSKQRKGSQTIHLLDGSLKTFAELKCEPKSSSSMRDEAEPSSLRTRRNSTGWKNGICVFCLREEEVICCTTPCCPAGFHVRCSGKQDPSNGDWYCQKCKCPSCESPLRGNDFRDVFCTLCGDQYHMECGPIRRPDLTGDFEWFCSEYCEEAFGILDKSGEVSLDPSNPHMLTLVRWTGSLSRFPKKDEPESIPGLLYVYQLKPKATEAKKLYYALHLLNSSFKDENGVSNQTDVLQRLLYPVNPDEDLGPTPESSCLDNLGFYAVLLEKDNNIMTVATIRIHSQKVAEMPFVATSQAHRGKGFCRNLMKHLKKMLRRIGVQELVVQSPPDFLAMWASKYSLHPVDGDAKISLLKCNLVKLPGTTLLCKKIQRGKSTLAAE